jgi:hypothetical protein
MTMLWINVVESKYCGLFLNIYFKEKSHANNKPYGF